MVRPIWSQPDATARSVCPCKTSLDVDGARLSITYELADDGAPAMPWDVYEPRVRGAWQQLLESDPDEPAIQDFWETHPALVPGAHAAVGRLASGHAPFPAALIAQPALQGRFKRQPDFLWIASDSAFFNPVFIEIEAPSKPWLTKRGQQHHMLTQAVQQIQEWREWFDEPHHRQGFYEQYQVPLRLRRDRTWEPIWLLVYGRRSENPGGVSRQRARLRSQGLYAIPYEHIEPDDDAGDYVTVRNASGDFEAVSVPPTVELGPAHAEAWSLVVGKEAAVERSPWMSPQRKAFMRRRFSYWDAWARTRDHPGLTRLSDRE
jgi:Domain of unknown function (DUF4263)